MNEVILRSSQLAVGYPAKSRDNIVLQGIDLELLKGELVCFLGPNGVGKSTLLKTIAGVQSPLSGDIQLKNKDLSTFEADELAQTISVVLTDKVQAGNFTVFDLVALGRYPHTGWAGRLGPQDLRKVRKALRDTHTEAISHKYLYELSDGQLQKVMIARALAQDGELIILDEPTAHLDLTNRVEIMQLLKQLAHRTQKAIVVSTHELDLALQTADKLWLAAYDRPLISGMPESLVLSGDLSATFLQHGFNFDLATGKFRLKHHFSEKIQVTGEGPELYWTVQALERVGFETVEKAESLKIIIRKKDEKTDWVIHKENQEHTADSLEKVIQFLKRQ